MAGPRRGGRRQKVCYFTANGITHIDGKEVELKSSSLNVENSS